MEGVGARLGRSSTRYGPATVFTGPVRKWKKKWIPLTPPNNNNTSNHHHHQTAAPNGAGNGNNGSHLLLYKWTPITPSLNGNNGYGNGKTNGDNNEESKSSHKDDAVAVDEPPKRQFKYIPVLLCQSTLQFFNCQFDHRVCLLGIEKWCSDFRRNLISFDCTDYWIFLV